MIDGLTNEFDLTAQSVADAAYEVEYFMQLQNHLKKVAKSILSAKRATEDDVGRQIVAALSQWLMNVVQRGVAGATAGNSNKGKGGLGGLSREALRHLRAQAYTLPKSMTESDDSVDADGRDEEALLLDDDFDWAEGVSTSTGGGSAHSSSSNRGRKEEEGETDHTEATELDEEEDEELLQFVRRGERLNDRNKKSRPHTNNNNNNKNKKTSARGGSSDTLAEADDDLDDI